MTLLVESPERMNEPMPRPWSLPTSSALAPPTDGPGARRPSDDNFYHNYSYHYN
jgi:hypothetical protein